MIIESNYNHLAEQDNVRRPRLLLPHADNDHNKRVVSEAFQKEINDPKAAYNQDSNYNYWNYHEADHNVIAHNDILSDKPGETHQNHEHNLTHTHTHLNLKLC